jgi:hypothetical protein
MNFKVSKTMKYKEKILSPVKYFKYRIHRHGLKYLLKPTTSKYPKIFALGICYHSTSEIIICKIFNWELRLEHERGHMNGLKHTSIWKIGFVMHAYGILRGYRF